LDRTRKASREDYEDTLQYRTQNEALHEAELIEEKLTQLLTTVAHLEQTHVCFRSSVSMASRNKPISLQVVAGQYSVLGSAQNDHGI